MTKEEVTVTKLDEPGSIDKLPANSLNVYQVDVTNWCNATCTYCPQPTHKREKGFMTTKTFAKVLTVMKNDSLSLHHFGEPLMHRELEAFVVMAKECGKDVGFSTNGKLLTQERLDRLARYGLDWIRLHVDPFGVRLSSFKVPSGLEFTEHRLLVNNDAPKKEMVSYAGHLDIPQPPKRQCSYLTDKWRVVLWDGSIALCCCDIEGTRSLDLCRSCSGFVFKSPRDWGDYDGTGDDTLTRKLPVVK